MDGSQQAGSRRNSQEINSEDVKLGISSAVKADSTISIGTIARALEGIALGETDPIGHGANHYKDKLQFRPLTEDGRNERALQIEAKKAPLKESLGDATNVLTKPVELINVLNDYNQYVVPIKFNGQDKQLIITPSSLTRSIDIEIPGEGSKNVNLSMRELIVGLAKLFPSVGETVL
jgi:hypothetical protein